MKTTMLFIVVILVSLTTVYTQKTSVIGDLQTVEKSFLELPRIQVIPIKDTETDRQYELYIKLPEGYAEDNDTAHPVIYYTDAMWHVEMLSGSAEYIMEEAILVGISWQKDISEELIEEAGAHVSRYRDYSMSESSNPEHQAKYQFGQSSSHLIFISNDVIPYVESNYLADPDNRSYFGYSLGGEFGAYTLLARPETFKNYILGSPTLRGEIMLLSKLNSNVAQDSNINVFISYGSQEKELGEATDEFIALLNTSNENHLFLQHMVIEGSHQTAFPMTVVSSVSWLSDLMKE